MGMKGVKIKSRGVSDGRLDVSMVIEGAMKKLLPGWE
jgi:hypothetical protein